MSRTLLFSVTQWKNLKCLSNLKARKTHTIYIMPCFGFSKFPKLKLKLQKSYIVSIQCSGANFEQNVGWTQLSADHSSISSSFGLQQQHSKRNPRTKHEKLHYKKVINHATYINYHCWMGPWTFIKLFGVFGALAAPSALTLPWPY